MFLSIMECWKFRPLSSFSAPPEFSLMNSRPLDLKIVHRGAHFWYHCSKPTRFFSLWQLSTLSLCFSHWVDAKKSKHHSRLKILVLVNELRARKLEADPYRSPDLRVIWSILGLILLFKKAVLQSILVMYTQITNSRSFGLISGHMLKS